VQMMRQLSQPLIAASLAATSMMMPVIPSSITITIVRRAVRTISVAPSIIGLLFFFIQHTDNNGDSPSQTDSWLAFLNKERIINDIIFVGIIVHIDFTSFCGSLEDVIRYATV